MKTKKQKSVKFENPEFPSGFDAFGCDVPVHRLMKGYECVKQMIPDISKEKAYSIIAKCANIIKKDRPFEIIGAVTGLDKDLDIIDITGRYRLMATLMAG